MNNFQKNTKFGFTLIEVMTVSGIMALFSVTLIGVFMASFRGGSKAQLIQRIRQDGDYALTSMSREIKKAKTIDSCGADLQLTLVDGSSIMYSLSSDKIASGSSALPASSYLTGTGKAENLNFNCVVGQTGNQIVTMSFTLTAGVAASRAEEKLSQDFATSVSTRQQ